MITKSHYYYNFTSIQNILALSSHGIIILRTKGEVNSHPMSQPRRQISVIVRVLEVKTKREKKIRLFKALEQLAYFYHERNYALIQLNIQSLNSTHPNWLLK